MSQARVRGILNSRLNTLATASLPIKWDNVTAKPVTGSSLEAHFMPLPSASLSMSGDLEEFAGIYQVTVVTEFGKGDATSDSIIKDLQRQFKVNTVFKAVDGFRVQVVTPLSIAEGRTDGSGFWRVPCWFEYRSEVYSADHNVLQEIII